MKNKTVIRRPNKPGEFTTIHNSILLDTRLSALELRILIIILCDADNFNLTQNLILNRLGIDKKTLQKAFKGLEVCGYLRRTELPRGHYYTISEYGNLKKGEAASEEVQVEIQEPIAAEQLPVAEITAQPIDLADYFGIIESLLPSHATDENVDDIMVHLVEAVSEGRLSDPKQMTEANLKMIINKFIPIPSTTEVTKYITMLCEIHGDGRQITNANKATITAKVNKYFKDNLHVEPNEIEIRKIIRMYKTSYTSSGHLDQRYQN